MDSSNLISPLAEFGQNSWGHVLQLGRNRTVIGVESQFAGFQQHGPHCKTVGQDLGYYGLQDRELLDLPSQGAEVGMVIK